MHRKPSNAFKHGRADSVEHRAWMTMRRACLNPHDPRFRFYGAKGITMAPEWRDDFAAFFEYIGRKPSPGLALRRLDVEKNFEPGNVAWGPRGRGLVPSGERNLSVEN